MVKYCDICNNTHKNIKVNRCNNCRYGLCDICDKIINIKYKECLEHIPKYRKAKLLASQNKNVIKNSETIKVEDTSFYLSLEEIVKNVIDYIIEKIDHIIEPIIDVLIETTTFSLIIPPVIKLFKSSIIIDEKLEFQLKNDKLFQQMYNSFDNILKKMYDKMDSLTKRDLYSFMQNNNYKLNKNNTLLLINIGNQIMTYTHYKYILIDLETTGFNKNTNSIIQIGAKIFDEDNIFNKYINPDVEIPSIIETLTGITNTFIKQNGTPLKNVLTEFILWMLSIKEPLILVGHNINTFDIPFLEAEFIKAGINNWQSYVNIYGSIDTLKIIKYDKTIKKSFTDIKNCKLLTIYKYLYDDIPINVHNAIGDINMIEKILNHTKLNYLWRDTDIKQFYK